MDHDVDGVGRRGAGKSTLLKALLGFVPPDGGAGSLSVFGLDVAERSLKIRARLGYMPESDAHFPGLNAIALAQALVHDPDLLFLDEPTNGMDPKGRAEMLDLIRDLAQRKGVNVIVSSHVLPDVEAACDNVVRRAGPPTAAERADAGGCLRPRGGRVLTRPCRFTITVTPVTPEHGVPRGARGDRSVRWCSSCRVPCRTEALSS